MSCSMVLDQDTAKKLDVVSGLADEGIELTAGEPIIKRLAELIREEMGNG